MKLLNNGEVVSGAALAVLGAYIIVESRKWEYLGPDGPGPGFFPLWYGIGLLALSLALVVVNWKRVPPAPAVSEGQGGERRALTAWVALVVCVGMLKPLGFLIAFGLFTVFLVRVLYGQSFGRALAVGVGGSLGFYLLFDKALNVTLPAGVLGF